MWFNNQSFPLMNYAYKCIGFFPCFVHKRNNYHSWIFSLVSNRECGVIDSNFDLQPISRSGLIIFSHYPVLFSVQRLVFVLLAAVFTWFWCAPARESQERRPRLERTKVGILQLEHPVVEHFCVFMCLTAVQHPEIRLQTAFHCGCRMHSTSLGLTTASGCLLGWSVVTKSSWGCPWGIWLLVQYPSNNKLIINPVLFIDLFRFLTKNVGLYLKSSWFLRQG